jgi:hypothetical protein
MSDDSKERTDSVPETERTPDPETARKAQACFERMRDGTAVQSDFDWVNQLPRRAGSMPDTEYIQSPVDGLWYEVPRAPSKQETISDAESKLGLDAETLRKIARAERERIMSGFADRSVN